MAAISAKRTVQPKQQRDQSQMADSRIRQHAFHVPLENRRICAQHQRKKTRGANNPEPRIGAGKHGPEPHQQKYPCLDHGGRVQVNRYRRRRRHRVRQPEMKRKLGTLGKRAQRDENQHGQIPRVRANQITRSQARHPDRNCPRCAPVSARRRAGKDHRRQSQSTPCGRRGAHPHGDTSML